MICHQLAAGMGSLRLNHAVAAYDLQTPRGLWDLGNTYLYAQTSGMPQ
jgi:hypothetical protein